MIRRLALPCSLLALAAVIPAGSPPPALPGPENAAQARRIFEQRASRSAPARTTSTSTLAVGPVPAPATTTTGRSDGTPRAEAGAVPSTPLARAPFDRLLGAMRTTTTTTPRKRVPLYRPALSRFLLCVRHRESRDNYRAVNRRSGAGGGFQFLPSTWAKTKEHAGWLDLPSRAELASPADQDAMAVHLFAWQGRSPWEGPGC